MSLALARTWLFVPGNRPDRFAKAAASGADVVIVDLEDAVDPAEKASAREATVAALLAGGQLVVRVNAADTADFALDLEALATISPRPLAVLVAKAERAADLLVVAEALQCPVVPLVESARGLVAAEELAGADGVVRLAFGAVDFCLDVGAEPADDVLAPVRSRLVTVSRAAGIAAPLDTPALDIADVAAVSAATLVARRFGMGGKLCIHPAQVAAVAGAFAPTAADLEWARRVLAAATGDGAASHEGKMIDKPVLERARRIVVSAGATA